MALETAPANTVKLPPWASQWLMRSSDQFYKFLPQRKPSQEAFERCRLVGHRGCKDVKGIAENTFAAYDYALQHGAQGIEIDLRWSQDQQLVVAHDPDLQRVFALPHVIAEHSADELKSACPQLPLFSEVVERYRGRLTLYIELKKDGWHDLKAQQQTLLKALGTAVAGQDYFVMSFDLDLLAALDQFAPSSKVAIMHSNPSDVKALIPSGQFGTIGGHYLLLTGAFRALCSQHQVKLGVGFPASRNSFWREVGRGAEFAMVDNPATVAAWR